MEPRYPGRELVELVSKQCAEAIELDQLQAPQEQRLRLWQAQMEATNDFIDGLASSGRVADGQPNEQATASLLKKLFLPPRPPD